ncbi:MAG: hypothetical protein AAFO72_14220 [Pseudomonadota bacterium]
MLKVMCSAFALMFLGVFGSVQAQTLAGPIVDSVDQSGSGSNSGHEGQDRILRRNISENRALTGLYMSERYDAPCHLQTWYRSIQTQEPFAGTGGMFECGSKDGIGTWESYRSVILPSEFRAVGVQVCMNKPGTKVKGVALIGFRQECETFSEADIHNEYQYWCWHRAARFERHKCVGSNSGVVDDDWLEPAMCPYQHYAIGVKLSTRAGNGGRRIIDGIGLKCARFVN